MLNLGKFVEQNPVVKAVKSLPSPIGWWEITSAEGEEGERTENHGVFYGHLVEILFSVPNNAGWQYGAKHKPNMSIPAERPFYTPVRKAFELSYFDFRMQDAPWNALSDIKTFTNWIDCADRVKVSKSNLYETYALELVN